MKEVEKKDTPAISGGYMVPDPVVIPVTVPIEEYPQNPNMGSGGDELPIGADR